MNLQVKIDKARWWVLENAPFYGQLVMALKDVITESVPTACTNGRLIKWGESFLGSLTDPEVRFVLLHETLHCAHGHLWRLPPDDNGQKACDYAINATLCKSGLEVSMPKCGLLDSQWDGMAEEEIYSSLQQRQNAQKQQQKAPGISQDAQGGNQQGEGSQGAQEGPKSDPGGCGGFEEPAEDPKGPEDGPQDSPQDAQDGQEGSQGEGAGAPASLREEWQEKVIQSAIVSEH